MGGAISLLLVYTFMTWTETYLFICLFIYLFIYLHLISTPTNAHT